MTQHSALVGHQPKSTPQSEPIPGSGQVENSAGGFAWAVDCFSRLRRFLILGTEGGTYYIGQRQLVTENVTALDECLKADGLRLVKEIVEISDQGRAASNDPALFALAYAAKKGDVKTRQAALAALPEVARIGTHLFHFASYIKALGGFGRATKRAIAQWYGRDVQKVAYQAVKYRQRDGWSHRDLLRLGHVRPGSAQHNAIFKWITAENPTKGDVNFDHEVPIIEGFIQAQQAKTARETARLVREYDLPREAIQTEHLQSVEVWRALMENMPIGAMVRNLATMTVNGTLTPTATETQMVVDQLANDEAISKSRIHPIAVLAALKTYAQGRGFRSDQTWHPITSIVDALDGAFYKAFGNVEPSRGRILIGLDVSGSMFGNPINGVPGLDAAQGAGAMALVTLAVENLVETVAFTSKRGGSYRWRANTELESIPLSPRQRLDDVMKVMSEFSRRMGGTDCSLPMLYALENEREVDAFIVYTDNETWAGTIHPAQALQRYRDKTGINAKLIVVGMTSNGFSIADPKDAGMLDVVGFDTATPNIMSEFIAGKV